MSRSLASSLPPALKKLIPQTTATQLSLQPRNLYETLSRLPKDGVGSRVYQTRWQSKKIGGSYYEVTRVSLKDEGKHGKAWGRLVWKGRPVTEEERIRGALKYRWDVGISRGIVMKASAPAELESTPPSSKSASTPSNTSSPKVRKRPETQSTSLGTSDKNPAKQTT